MPTIDITKPITAPADLAALLEAELKDVRHVCDQIQGGRARLAEYLGVRPPEISRMLNTPGYQPDGRFLAGMRAFADLWREQFAPPKKKTRSAKK